MNQSDSVLNISQHRGLTLLTSDSQFTYRTMWFVRCVYNVLFSFIVLLIWKIHLNSFSPIWFIHPVTGWPVVGVLRQMLLQTGCAIVVYLRLSAGWRQWSGKSILGCCPFGPSSVLLVFFSPGGRFLTEISDGLHARTRQIWGVELLLVAVPVCRTCWRLAACICFSLSVRNVELPFVMLVLICLYVPYTIGYKCPIFIPIQHNGDHQCLV